MSPGLAVSMKTLFECTSPANPDTGTGVSIKHCRKRDGTFPQTLAGDPSVS